MDGIIKLRLGSKECTDIERLKLTQVQGKLEAFWSHAHETSYKEKLDESLLDSMRRNVFALDNELVILSEKLRTAENDPAQKDVAELKKLAQNACDKEDYETEFKYYRIAADKGDAEAQHLLGTMYKNGTGVKQDYQEAARYFRLAADQGDADAQFCLGMMYLHDDGVRKNPQKALKYIRLAAQQGLEKAQVILEKADADW